MKALLLLICLISFTANSPGQSAQIAKPDFSGIWEFEAGRSSVVKSKKGPPEQITITHHDPDLVIRRKVVVQSVPEVRDLTYHTDGRGETNPTTDWITTNTGETKPVQTASQTTWNKNKIVTRSISRSHAGTAIIEFVISKELSLSADGRTLTITTRTDPGRNVPANVAFAPRSGADFKMVYKLISK